MTAPDLTGKRVLVVGAETEVGRAVATAVAEAGGSVAAVVAEATRRPRSRCSGSRGGCRPAGGR